MKNLANLANGGEIFDSAKGLDSALVQEYFERNERKKADEAWLKKNGVAVKAAMAELGKDKVDVGDLRVAYSEPDTSKFDMNKVYSYLLDKYEFTNPEKFNALTTRVVNEDSLMASIESGDIDLEDLKSYAWVESKGSPRLVISKVKKND